MSNNTTGPTTDELLAARAKEVDAALTKLKTSDDRALQTLADNGEKRRELQSEFKSIPKRLHPSTATSTTSSRTKAKAVSARTASVAGAALAHRHTIGKTLIGICTIAVAVIVAAILTYLIGLWLDGAPAAMQPVVFGIKALVWVFFVGIGIYQIIKPKEDSTA